jgi:hypothetical protein
MFDSTMRQAHRHAEGRQQDRQGISRRPRSPYCSWVTAVSCSLLMLGCSGTGAWFTIKSSSAACTDEHNAGKCLEAMQAAREYRESCEGSSGPFGTCAPPFPEQVGDLEFRAARELAKLCEDRSAASHPDECLKQAEWRLEGDSRRRAVTGESAKDGTAEEQAAMKIFVAVCEGTSKEHKRHKEACGKAVLLRQKYETLVREAAEAEASGRACALACVSWCDRCGDAPGLCEGRLRECLAVCPRPIPMVHCKGYR